MVKVSKAKNIAKESDEVRLRLDDKTKERREKFFVEGDYQRIVEQAQKAGVDTSRKQVWYAFSAGHAAASLAREIKKFYAAKEKAQKELSA